MIDQILPMAKRFHDEGQPPWPWDESSVRQTIEALHNSPQGYVAARKGGFFLGQIAVNPFSRGWVMASELFWWSEDNNGLRLARDFRKWARSMGANEIVWSCPVEARANRVLSRYGKHSENIYSEVL